MKIKNIVFSGVMGAILATAANAAPTIASKAYVDGLVGENVTNLTQTIEENYNELSEDIGLNAAAITDNATAIAGVDAAYQAADTQIRTDFAAADAATLADAKEYTDDEITKLNNNLSSTGGSVDALALRVKANEDDIAAHTTDIATNASGVAENKAAIDAINNADTGLLSQAKAYTDELADGAVATNTAAIETLNGSGEGSVAKKIADAISTYATIEYVDTKDSALDTRVKANEDYIAQHKTDYQTLNSSVSTNTANIATNTGNITTLMANAETTGSVDNKVATSAAQTKTAYETYAIPKPNLHECNAVSGLCVLSYNSQGVLQWVDVTEESTTTPDEPTTGGDEA